MSLETGTYINDLVPTNPVPSDGLGQSDDHLRLIKAALKNTLPNFTSAVLYSTQAQIDVASSYVAALLSVGVTLGNGALRGNGTVPAGMMADFGGAAAPTGWLACDGQAISRTTYVDLFNAIGTTWGAGDGSTTFNVPNLVAYFRRHRDNASLAGAVGTKKNPANLSHTHTGSGTTGTENAVHSHFFSATSGAMSANATHTHGWTQTHRLYGNFQSYTSGGAVGGIQLNNGTDGSVELTSTNTDHTHAVSGTTGTESAFHAHAFSFTTSVGSVDDVEARPYSATVLTCIKT
ncbi:phage tail protein [Bradyrhizobium quebecense]|uniref:Tail fiber protein n=1 Tax=Bradyrhizobium quebecense TaxID=2748629 RepID=A0A973WRB1_9BRAD|nr:phage tail protein [Bradyrhizobium quebecense]UGA46788.1 phage tail protein [Bradyrhizobium quebecense]